VSSLERCICECGLFLLSLKGLLFGYLQAHHSIFTLGDAILLFSRLTIIDCHWSLSYIKLQASQILYQIELTQRHSLKQFQKLRKFTLAAIRKTTRGIWRVKSCSYCPCYSPEPKNYIRRASRGNSVQIQI
jgi:hypothetical protein